MVINTNFSIKEIKSIIMNSKSLVSTKTIGETYFNFNFEKFDFDFIDLYFTEYKKNYLKASYYNSFNNNIERKNHFINWMLWKSEKLLAQDQMWFSQSYIKFNAEHFSNILNALKNHFGDTTQFDLLCESIFKHFLKYIDNEDYKLDNKKMISVNAQFYFVDNKEFADKYPDTIKNVQDKIYFLFENHPLETIAISAIKGLSPNKKQQYILSKGKDALLELPNANIKRISTARFFYYDIELLKKYPNYNQFIKFEVRNSSGAIAADKVKDDFIKTYYFEEKTKLSGIRTALKKPIGAYEVSKYLNSIIAQMNEQSLCRLLVEINISRLYQNVEFLNELAFMIDNHGNLNEDQLELLILSYKI